MEASETYARVPPYSEDAERSVLGSLLLEAKAIRKCLDKEMVPEDFYVPAHRIIYEAICSVYDKKQLPDTITVSNELQKTGNIDHVGGKIFLDKLIDHTPTSAHLQYYMDIVLQKSKLRQAIAFARDMETEAFGADDDVESFLSKAKLELHQIGFNGKVPQTVSKIVEKLIAGYHGARQTGSTGLKSRWFDLQQKVVGYFKSKITIIAGRPGKGKTTMGLNEALHKAITGFPALIISIEMSEDEIIEKLIGDFAGLNIKQFRLGNVTYDDIQKFKLAGDIIEQLPLYIVDGNFTVEKICSTVREHVEEHGVVFVVIDYIQIVSPSPKKKFANRNAEISYMSQQLIALGNDTKVHMFVLSQLSRSYKKDEVPELHHLRDSGALEQDAYMVIFVYEDPAAEGDFPDMTPSIARVAKNRGGEEGEVNMIFNKFKQRFLGSDNESYRLENFMHLLKQEPAPVEEEPEEEDQDGTPF